MVKRDFSVDLIENAARHVVFLQSLHSNGITLATPSKESFRRYRDLWLPLVFEHQDKELIPPADIAWLWHCHRLTPFRYVAFCKSRFGEDCPILEANHPFAFQMNNKETDKTSENTYCLWKGAYSEEPFHLPAIFMQSEWYSFILVKMCVCHIKSI